MHAGYYNPDRHQGNDRRQALLELAETLRQAGFDVPGNDALDRSGLAFRRGHVVAGEKLIADGSLQDYLETLDDRIRACDMEGAGFARACTRRNVQYLMFRGVSDCGNLKKSDDWQAAVAAFAMYDAMMFLQTQFRRRSEVGSLT